MATVETPDLFVSFCGWLIKHSPHIGYGIDDSALFSCPGWIEHIEPIEENFDAWQQ